MMASSVDLPAPLAPDEPQPRAVRHVEVDAAEGVDRDGSDVLPTDDLDDAMLQVVIEDREQLVPGVDLAEADVCHHATQYGSRDRARVNTARPTTTLMIVKTAVPM